MAKKKGLGRGLSSLLGEEAVVAVDNEPAGATQAGLVQMGANQGGVQDDATQSGMTLHGVAPFGADTPGDGGQLGDGMSARLLRIIDVYPNPDQPRKSFDDEALKNLADSVARHGVLQPIAVRAAEGGGYLLIAGERRWRASRLAGLDHIPAVVLDADDRVSAELALIENLQREDLNPVEEAEGFKSLADTYMLSDSEVGELVGRSRAYVNNATRLLNLEKPVLDMLKTGELSRGQARALLPLPPTVQTTLAEMILQDGLSVRQTEKLAKRALELEKLPIGKPTKPDKTVIVDYNAELGEHISSRMGRKVKIMANKGRKNQGWMCIEFYGDDDLDLLAGIILNREPRELDMPEIEED